MVNGSRIFSIHRDIGRLVQGNTTTSVYYSKLRQLWDEFASLVALPRFECDSARKYLEHDQQHKLLQFLMGRNESYAHVRSHSIQLVKLILWCSRGVSSILNVNNPTSIEPTSSVFYSAKGKFTDTKKDLITCVYCHWTGHSKENCHKLIGYPVGHRLHKVRDKRLVSEVSERQL